MTVVIDSSDDLTLDNVARVAWAGEECRLGVRALGAILSRRDEFVDFVEQNADRHLYGITTKHHVGAKSVLSEGGRTEFATRLPSTPATVGPRLPERLVRAIILARLADVLNGTACLRVETVQRLLDMLDTALPPVPARGNGEPGDIIPLGHLFRGRFDGTLEIGEGMALINGSPVAAAALSDAVLAGRRRIINMEQAMALAAVAMNAPIAHYAPELEAAWRDEHQAEALRNIRELLQTDDHSRELPYQAPVSFRSGPRLIGWARRAQASAEECAEIALSASSNNPIFVGPNAHPPHGAILSNGGYHNPLVAPSLDSLARTWADVCQLVTAQVNRIVEDPTGLVATEPESQVSLLYMTSAGWAEEARAAATPSLIGLGGAGQTDTGTPDLLAWRKAHDAGEALDANLAVLAVVASHALARKNHPAPRRLEKLSQRILERFPVGSSPVDFGPQLEGVVDLLCHPLDDATTPVSELATT
ncbi:aromatic amino acid lyase [Rhodococcus koreensis]|uniref:aromatic amino acid lyase n=1 Tax=Rhodococcus koreensis TaxID=99653 RepID=UPI0036D9406A